MSDDVVLVDSTDQIAIITLHRPEKLNAVTRAMADAYAQSMRDADADPHVRAIVITGAGRGFCAGADLGVLGGGSEALAGFLPALEDFPDLALRLRTPVIAAVNGPVAGIGFAYMLGSDIRFAAQGAPISTTFARLGLVAEYGLSWLLPKLIGLPYALDLLLTGRTISAEDAARMGLINEVVPAEALMDRALVFARDLAENCSPRSLAAIKAQVYGDFERDRAQALAQTVELMRESITWPDLAEALQARTEQRPHRFPSLDPAH